MLPTARLSTYWHVPAVVLLYAIVMLWQLTIMLYIANASDLADLFKNFLGISFVLQTDEVVADSLKKKMPRDFYATKSSNGQVSIWFSRPYAVR